MKRRYLYLLLFGVPALLAALLIAFMLSGAVAGALWLFVFGDNPWPSYAGHLLPALFALVCVLLWSVFLSVAYKAGKKQEQHAALNARHVMVALAATVLLVLIGAAHQWRVGNIGAPSNSVLCSDYCRSRGFAASGTPPEDAGAANCSCYDAGGGEAVRVPLADITAGQD